MSRRQGRTHRRHGPCDHRCFHDLPGRFDRNLRNRRRRDGQRLLRHVGLVGGVVIRSRKLLLLAFGYGGTPARGFLHRGFPAQAAAHQQSLIVFQ
jgi:hypothetical protein